MDKVKTWAFPTAHNLYAPEKKYDSDNEGLIFPLSTKRRLKFSQYNVKGYHGNLLRFYHQPKLQPTELKINGKL